MRGISMSAGVLAMVFAVTATLGSDALADVQHTVAKGHTLEAIANRYHVTVKSIIDANKLKDPKHLKVGDVLTIPKVDPPKKPDGDKSKDPKAKVGKDGKPEHGSSTFAAKAKTPGVVHIHRIATTEEQDVHVGSSKISSQTLKTMEKLLRSPSGASHPIEARLVSLLATVSNHFGSRKIEVVSGFRPYTPTQYNPHSNHNHGKAVDFRVVGVPNEAVRDFCRTLKNTGCGYYPNSVFVHMDVRETSAFWIDYSKPGEAPRYNAADVDADEGASEVHGDGSGSVNTPPPETPTPSVPTDSDTTPSLNPDDDG